MEFHSKFYGVVLFMRTRNPFGRGVLVALPGEPPNAKKRMMRAMSKILSTFQLPPKPPSDTEGDRERLARRTVAEHSHGNIYLQLGEFDTAEDIQKEVEEVKGFDFRRNTTNGDR